MKKTLLFIISFSLGMFLGGRLISKRVNNRLSQIENTESKYGCLERWIQFENKNNSIKSSLLKKNINNIVIYGCGDIGVLLIKKLKNEDEINIVAVMDQNTNLKEYEDIPIIAPYKLPRGVNCVIVTVINQYDKIKKEIEMENNVQVLCINDLFED